MPDLRNAGPAGLNLLTATEAAERIARGATTSVALVEACLARIDARDGELHAWTYVDREHALAQARARDGEPRRSRCTACRSASRTSSTPTTCRPAYGSSIHAGHRPAIDSVVVALMRRAGLVILGKCTTTEFASPVPAGVRNPHDFTRTPGVSSSGSAAAVADFMVPLAIGSQTGGSTILPAAFCGIVGYKASLTGIDRGNIRQLRPTLDTIGLLARSIADVAALHGVLNGGAGALGEGRRRHAPHRRLPHQQLAARATRNRRRDGGCRKAPGRGRREHAPGRIAGRVRRHRGNIRRDLVGRGLARAGAGGARTSRQAEFLDQGRARRRRERHTPARFDQAQRHAIECQRALASLFESCDVLLTPSTSGEAPADLISVSSSAFNRTWTLMHVPCVTIPAYRGPNGMPVGVQIVGPIGSDARTMSAAQAIADVLM